MLIWAQVEKKAICPGRANWLMSFSLEATCPVGPPVSSVFTPKPKYPFLNLGLKLAPMEVKAKSGTVPAESAM